MSFNVSSNSQSFENYLNNLQNEISKKPTDKAAQKVFDNIITNYEQLTLHADHLAGLSGERVSTDGLKPEQMERFTQIASQLKNGIVDKDNAEMLIIAEKNFRQTLIKKEAATEKEAPFNWDKYVKALEEAKPELEAKSKSAKEKSDKEYEKNRRYNEMRKVGSYISYGAAAVSLGLAAIALISGIGLPIALAAYALSIPFYILGKNLGEDKITPEYKQAIKEHIRADLENFKTTDLPNFKNLVSIFGDKIKENNLSPIEANPIFRTFHLHINGINKVKRQDNEKTYDILNLNDSEKEALSQILQKLIVDQKK